MSKNHRSGGKMGGKHTTVIDAAEKVVDFLLKLPEVSNVVAGRIKSGIGTAQQRIKFKKRNRLSFGDSSRRRQHPRNQSLLAKSRPSATSTGRQIPAAEMKNAKPKLNPIKGLFSPSLDI